MASELRAFWVDPAVDPRHPTFAGEVEEFTGTFTGPLGLSWHIEQGIKAWAWQNNTRVLRYHVFEESDGLFRGYRVKVLAAGTPWLLLIAALVVVGLVLVEWSSRKFNFGELPEVIGELPEMAGGAVKDFLGEAAKGVLPIALLLIAVLVVAKS